VIVEDGILWLVTQDSGTGVEDPFAGLPEDYVHALEASYSLFRESVHIGQSICTCSAHDEDFVSLDEGKSLSGWQTKQKRTGLGRQLRTNREYQKMVSQERGRATTRFVNQVATFRRNLLAITRAFLADRLTLNEYRTQSSEAFSGIYYEAWQAGREASGLLTLQKRPRRPSREEESWFRSAVREELTFWNGFIDELAAGPKAFSKFSWEERLDMYVKTVWFMFYSARVSGLPDTVLLHWWPKRKKGRMCPGCEYMVKHSPYPRDLMPTVPRAGDTPCLMRCVHRVVARFVSPADVRRRRDELPAKESMIRSLRRFMGKKIKKYRGRTRDYNPWLGSTVWGELK